MAKKKLSTHNKKAKKRVVKKTTKKTAKRTVKKIVKKTIKKKPATKKKTAPKEKPIGTVTHYFPHVQAAVIKLSAPLVIGDTVKIKGHTTDLAQIVTSMQIDRVAITSAKKGDEIGLQVSSRVRQADKVYKG